MVESLQLNHPLHKPKHFFAIGEFLLQIGQPDTPAGQSGSPDRPVSIRGALLVGWDMVSGPRWTVRGLAGRTPSGPVQHLGEPHVGRPDMLSGPCRT